jgi:integral membrane sensor domain MASE1
MKNLHEPTYSFLFLVIGLIIINTVICRLAVILFPAGQTGVSAIFFPVAIMLLFTFWFGAYGAISSYVGTFFGAGLLSGIPFDVSLYWAFASLWQVLIPLIAFRVFNVNVGIENSRDLFHLILFGVIINNVVGAAWGAYTLAAGQIIPASQFISTFSAWLIGNIVITLLVVPLALRYFTPKVRKSKLFVHNYWV